MTNTRGDNWLNTFDGIDSSDVVKVDEDGGIESKPPPGPEVGERYIAGPPTETNWTSELTGGRYWDGKKMVWLSKDEVEAELAAEAEVRDTYWAVGVDGTLKEVPAPGPMSELEELKAAVTALTKRVAVLEIEGECCAVCFGRNSGVVQGAHPGMLKCERCDYRWEVGTGVR